MKKLILILLAIGIIGCDSGWEPTRADLCKLGEGRPSDCTQEEIDAPINMGLRNENTKRNNQHNTA